MNRSSLRGGTKERGEPLLRWNGGSSATVQLATNQRSVIERVIREVVGFELLALAVGAFHYRKHTTYILTFT